MSVLLKLDERTRNRWAVHKELPVEVEQMKPALITELIDAMPEGTDPALIAALRERRNMNADITA